MDLFTSLAASDGTSHSFQTELEVSADSFLQTGIYGADEDGRVERASYGGGELFFQHCMGVDSLQQCSKSSEDDGRRSTSTPLLFHGGGETGDSFFY